MNAKQFDLLRQVLIHCGNLQEACKNYAIDLISVDLSQRMDSMLFGKSARAAVSCVSRQICYDVSVIFVMALLFMSCCLPEITTNS